MSTKLFGRFHQSSKDSKNANSLETIPSKTQLKFSDSKKSQSDHISFGDADENLKLDTKTFEEPFIEQEEPQNEFGNPKYSNDSRSFPISPPNLQNLSDSSQSNNSENHQPYPPKLKIFSVYQIETKSQNNVLAETLEEEDHPDSLLSIHSKNDLLEKGLKPEKSIETACQLLSPLQVFPKTSPLSEPSNLSSSSGGLLKLTTAPEGKKLKVPTSQESSSNTPASHQKHKSDDEDVVNSPEVSQDKSSKSKNSINFPPLIRNSSFRRQRKGGGKSNELSQQPEFPSSSARTCEPKDVQDVYEELINSGVMPPEAYVANIFQMLNQDAYTAVENEDYDKADQICQAFKIMNQASREAEKKKQKSQKFQILERRLWEADQNLKMENKAWDERIRNYYHGRQERENELENKHYLQLKEFDENWKKPENIRPYTKPSSELLRLRKIQKTLAINQSYKAAKQVKIQADQLLNQESRVAEDKILQTINQSKKILLEKQAKETLCFVEREKRIECQFLSDKERAINPYVIQVKTLRQFLEGEKENDYRSEKSSYYPSSRFRAIEASSRPLSAKSPRTVQAYVDLKNRVDTARLKVNPAARKQALRIRKLSNSGK